MSIFMAAYCFLIATLKQLGHPLIQVIINNYDPKQKQPPDSEN
jgi:hypothetical protein